MKAEFFQTEIAKVIGVHKSTISREMRCNRIIKDIGSNKLNALLLKDGNRPLVSCSTGHWLGISFVKTGVLSKSVDGLIVDPNDSHP